MRSYPVNLILLLPASGRLIIFGSFSASDEIYHEIYGREVFLYNESNRPVWQIDPEPGASDDMYQNFNAARPATDPCVSIYTVDGRFYASRFRGDTFLIDMDTGHATYSGWART